jgi:hypothetical protein
MNRELLDDVKFDRKPRLKPGKAQSQLRSGRNLLPGLVRILSAITVVVLLCFAVQQGCVSFFSFVSGQHFKSMQELNNSAKDYMNHNK